MVGNDASFFPHMDEEYEELVKEKSTQLDNDADDTYSRQNLYTLRDEESYFYFQR